MLYFSANWKDRTAEDFATLQLQVDVLPFNFRPHAFLQVCIKISAGETNDQGKIKSPLFLNV